ASESRVRVGVLMRLRTHTGTRWLWAAGNQRAGRDNGRRIDGSERTRKWHGHLCHSSADEISSTFARMRAGSQAESRMGEPDKIRVLIADDHVTVLEGLA